jgi:hypothetical protein
MQNLKIKMNKYQTSIDSSYYDRSNGLHSTLGCNNGASNSMDSKPTGEQSSFFSDDQYRDHSKQLVDAFKQWFEQINFVTYEYDQGELWKYNEALVKPTVPYMDQMQKHLDAAYEDSFPDLDLDFIQSERMKICHEMAEMMITPSTSIPHGPTFETVISNKIKSKCPILMKTEDVELPQNSSYVSTYVYSIIFKVVSGKRKLELKVKPIPGSDDSELIDSGVYKLAHGKTPDINNLKNTLEKLAIDNDIQNIVRKYYDLKNQLGNDQNVIQFRNVVKKFYEFIHGGKVLGGPGSCDLCVGTEFKVK